MKVSPIGPSTAKPTKGELLAQLETLSRKPRSEKRKTLDSVKKDRPERALSPPAEAPTVLSSQPRSGSATKVRSPLGGAVE